MEYQDWIEQEAEEQRREEHGERVERFLPQEGRLMTPEKKKEIDALSICALLEAQLFAPIGDERFQGEEGPYRMKRLAELRSADNAAYVQASKSLTR